MEEVKYNRRASDKEPPQSVHEGFLQKLGVVPNPVWAVALTIMIFTYVVNSVIEGLGARDAVNTYWTAKSQLMVAEAERAAAVVDKMEAFEEAQSERWENLEDTLVALKVRIEDSEYRLQKHSELIAQGQVIDCLYAQKLETPPPPFCSELSVLVRKSQL